MAKSHEVLERAVVIDCGIWSPFEAEPLERAYPTTDVGTCQHRAGLPGVVAHEHLNRLDQRWVARVLADNDRAR
jgi:hypothetical protein